MILGALLAEYRERQENSGPRLQTTEILTREIETSLWIEKHESMSEYWIVRGSPQLTTPRLLVALAKLGGFVDEILDNGDKSSNGVHSLVVNPRDSVEELRGLGSKLVVEVVKFAGAKLYMLPESNIAVLTSEGISDRMEINRETVNKVRAILREALGYAPREVVLNYISRSAKLLTESIIFIGN